MTCIRIRINVIVCNICNTDNRIINIHVVQSIGCDSIWRGGEVDCIITGSTPTYTSKRKTWQTHVDNAIIRTEPTTAGLFQHGVHYLQKGTYMVTYSITFCTVTLQDAAFLQRIHQRKYRGPAASPGS